MKCESIVTRVKHEVRGKTRKDSFFLLECDPWENFVLKILGECYVDEESMRNFELWLTQDSGSYQLMVSLDYKYARVVKPYRPDVIFAPGEQALPMLPNEVYGPPVEKLIPALQRELKELPVERLRYGLKMRGTELEKRVDFGSWVIYEFDPLVIFEDYAPGRTKDVVLVWHFIANENPNENMPNLVKDLHERMYSGWRVEDEWFKAAGLTFDELELRRERARIHFERLMDCEVPSWAPDSVRLKEVHEYLKEVTDTSELLELLVLAFECMGRPKVNHEPSCREGFFMESDENLLWNVMPTSHHSPFLVCCGTATDHFNEQMLRERKLRQPKWEDLKHALFRRLGQLLSRSERRIYSPAGPVEPVYLDEEDMQL